MGIRYISKEESDQKDMVLPEMAKYQMLQNIRDMISCIGDDPNSPDMIETPARVMNSWEELYAGYNQDPRDIFKTFDGEGCGGLVYLKDVEFHSVCRHHMLGFSGSAFIAYIPNGHIIGISKLARLLDIFSRRLQVQERIAEQVTDALMEYLQPKGAACLLEAKHSCISCRGVMKQHSVMGYSSMKGMFLKPEGAAARAELMSLWSK